MQGLEGLRFLYVTGKGGVGKSTIAAALGLQLARSGRKVLLTCEAGAFGRERLLGVRPEIIPKQVCENLYCLAIDADHSMRQYSESILRSRKLVEVLFQTQVAKGFLGGIPGLAAWAFLGKAWSYADERATGLPRELEGVQTVIVDAPATGDGTDVLRTPAIIRELAPKGRFRRDAELCEELLHDPRRSAVVPVTLLEDLPVTETEELLRVVRDDLQMPLGPLVLNQVRSELFSEAQSKLLLQKVNPPGEATPAGEAIDRGWERARAEEQARNLTLRLESWGLPLLRVPHLRPEPTGLAGLRTLAEALAEAPRRSYRPTDP